MNISFFPNNVGALFLHQKHAAIISIIIVIKVRFFLFFKGGSILEREKIRCCCFCLVSCRRLLCLYFGARFRREADTSSASRTPYIYGVREADEGVILITIMSAARAFKGGRYLMLLFLCSCSRGRVNRQIINLIIASKVVIISIIIVIKVRFFLFFKGGSILEREKIRCCCFCLVRRLYAYILVAFHVGYTGYVKQTKALSARAMADVLLLSRVN